MIQNGLVVNIAVWDGVTPWSPEGFIVVQVPEGLTVSSGWSYNGTSFIQPTTTK
jgi:hypothetical protein